MRPQFLTRGRQISVKHSSGKYKVGLTVVCNSRVKKLEQAQNHGDWRAAHRAAAAFFLNPVSYTHLTLPTKRIV